jgi:DtxR family transcriptional regulator, Mn-dependent transcriptional regulator
MTASNQKYLKAVYVLSQKNDSVRIVDIAAVLSVSKASACSGLKKPAEKGYITHEFYGDVRLTPEGKKKAQELSASYSSLMRRIGGGASRPAGFEYLLQGQTS